MRKLLYGLTIATLLLGSAQAMDATKEVKSIDGSEFVGSDGKALGLTYLTVIENALLTAPAASEDEKTKNYILTLKIHQAAKDYTPTPDDIIRIRKALAATQATAVYGQVMSTIDPTFGK